MKLKFNCKAPENAGERGKSRQAQLYQDNVLKKNTFLDVHVIIYIHNNSRYWLNVHSKQHEYLLNNKPNRSITLLAPIWRHRTRHNTRKMLLSRSCVVLVSYHHQHCLVLAPGINF